MKNKVSQKDIVLKQMRAEGFVTRNWCLQHFISRLSAIMLDLKNEGVNFKTEHMESGDYKYTLLDKPKFFEEFRNPETKELILKRAIW